jgi:hypothetical protein
MLQSEVRFGCSSAALFAFICIASCATLMLTCLCFCPVRAQERQLSEALNSYPPSAWSKVGLHKHQPDVGEHELPHSLHLLTVFPFQTASSLQRHSVA